MSRSSRHIALTLIEALTITIVLGLAAVVMVPRFTEAGSDMRDAALRTSLKLVRNQIHLYRIQHNGVNPTLDGFVNQMTHASNIDGQTAPFGTEGFPFGPYLQSIPANPYTGTHTISTAPGGTSAWYYDSDTGVFRPNHPSSN